MSPGQMTDLPRILWAVTVLVAPTAHAVAADVRQHGAHSVTEPGYAGFDSTTALQEALSASDEIEIPAGV